MQTYFHNLDASTLCGKTIIIDIDGTLVADGRSIVSKEAQETINELSKRNRLYICSNNKDIQRNKTLSRQININFINSAFKKPSKRVIDSIQDYRSGNTIIIGDKFITDGIFARRIGARFIKIKRIRSGEEEMIVKLVYFTDDLIYHLIRIFL